MHIHCIYSSGGGNTKIVLDLIQEIRVQHDIQMSFVKAIVATAQDFCSSAISVLACPTYDHGLLHTPMENLFAQMREEGLSLQGRSFILVGLGDPKYDKDYLVESLRLMREFVTEQGGIVFGEPLKVIGNPLTQMEEIQTWGRNLAALICTGK